MELTERQKNFMERVNKSDINNGPSGKFPRSNLGSLSEEGVAKSLVEMGLLKVEKIDNKYYYVEI